MGICKVIIINKGLGVQCNFFVVPESRSTLLGMSDCKILELLSINCGTMIADQHGIKQKKQDKFKTKNSKIQSAILQQR